MSTVVAFNTVLVQFMKELAETFPSDMKMKIYRVIVEGLCQGEATVGVDTFRESLLPHKDRILARDETVFDVVEPLFGQVDLAAIWKSGLSDDNKNVVWEYLGALTTMCAGSGSENEQALALAAAPASSSDALAALASLASPSFDPSALASMVPPEIGDVVSQMMQGVDMQDIVALAKDIDEKDVQDIVTAIDPAAMTGLMSNFSIDKLMDVAKGIDPSKLSKIADKFDKDRLARVASKVDQETLMAMLGGGGSKKSSHRKTKK
jgi:hypothetical protein